MTYEYQNKPYEAIAHLRNLEHQEPERRVSNVNMALRAIAEMMVTETNMSEGTRKNLGHIVGTATEVLMKPDDKYTARRCESAYLKARSNNIFIG